MNDPFGIRPGEVAVPLPENFDAALYFIGRIRTPWTRSQGLPEERARIRCGLHHRGRPALGRGAQGHRDLQPLIVLYWMDRARRDLVFQVPGHYGTGRGSFALRSPVRPNPIALSVARLLRVEGTRLSVVGLDCLDNTPLLDLKPYFASTDAVPDAVVGWHAARKIPHPSLPRKRERDREG